MKIYIKFYLILFISISYGQIKEINPFVIDSIYHKEYVNSFIDNLKSRKISNIIYLSDSNFYSNDTYIIWEFENKIMSKLITNRKTKKKIKSKKLDLSKIQKDKFSELFSNNINFNFLNEFNNCKSVLSHFYFFDININENNYVINSKCIPNLKKNKLIGHLIGLIYNDLD